MHLLKQSTAATVFVGPVLDSTGAAYTGMTNADFSASKDGAAAYALSTNSATVTHVANGIYTVALTTTDVDTKGRYIIYCNKSTYAMSVFRYTILVATVFDALVTNATTAAGGLGDIQRMAGTALTARDIGASVLLSSGTGTGQLSITSGVVSANVTQYGGSAGTFASGRPEVNATHFAGTISAGQAGYVGLDWGHIYAPTSSAGLSGTVVGSVGSIQGDLGGKVLGGGSGTITGVGVQADLQTIKTQTVTCAAGVTFPASIASPTNITAGTITTVSGNVTGSVGSIATGGIAAASFAAGAIDAAAIATDAITSAELAASATAEIAAAVWDLATSGHTTSGTFGAAMNAAGSAGDPWSTSLPGAYSSGTAGYILGTNLNATSSSIYARIGAPAGASIAADIAAVKVDTAAILDDTGTSGVVVASGSKTGYSLASTGLDAIVIETGLNARQALAVNAAALAGVLSGGGTTTVTIKGAGVATTRILATVDADGNRSAVTLTLPS